MKTSVHSTHSPNSFTTILVALLLCLFAGNTSFSQSGGWGSSFQNGTTGYNDYGNGVIQLLSTASSGCASAAIHDPSTYDPTTGGVYSKCYQVFFGCPGNDQIGSDTKGDGMAFSFSKCAYNINNGSCGGGLGYHGACGQMITIEFDTWSSVCNSNFDCIYQGTGNQDQIALHKNGDASMTGYVTGTTPGNLEDGLEHAVCFSYDPATDIYSVTIDGTPVFTYDATGTGNELEVYFGAGGLTQTWSSGKNGATNPTTISRGFDITDQIGTPLCPSGVEITSPSAAANFSDCPQGPITINATATPPAGNTVDRVEFFVDGVSIGTDFSANYSITWNSPTNGNHNLTATAYYMPSGTNNTSTAIPITVGGGIQQTSTAPTINGTQEALWSSYLTYNMTQGYNSAPDLAGSFKVMYDATYLYLFATITDEDLRNDSGNDWEDDGLELFIDIGNDKSGSYGGNDYQYGFLYGGGFNEYKWGATAGISYSQGTVAGGYTVEARIPWTTMSLGSAPLPGTNIGFDVKINDDDGGGTRDNELSWKDGSFGQWSNPSLFGTLQVTSCNPLPVSMLIFDGVLVDDVSVLNWITGSEKNNDKFIVQHSSNLNDWKTIGEVSGAGTSNALNEYEFTDESPVSGTNYYRLIQVDFEGKLSNSDVVSVEKFTGNTGIAPNPFENDFTVLTNFQGEHEIIIQDVVGRTLAQSTHDIQNGSLNLHLELPTGVYVITIKTKSFIDQKEIIRR